jgi:hypothetical protein
MEEREETRPWRFSAPESYLLLRGARASSREVLKLALAELVASGQARLEPREVRRLGFRRTVPALAIGRAPPAAPRAPLRAVRIELERASFGSASVDVSRLVEQVRSTYGSLDGYRDRAVLRPLIDEGLYVERRDTLLWLIPRVRRSLTPAGEAARDELEALRRRGPEELRGAGRPDAALTYAASAGAALLLMPELFPELRALDQLRRRESASDSTVYAGGSDGGGGSDPTWPGVPAPDSAPVATPTAISIPDPAGLELSLDFGWLDEIGGLDSVMDAIDAGIADGGGGGDGGGDGGGGDGGGGGD